MVGVQAQEPRVAHEPVVAPVQPLVRALQFQENFYLGGQGRVHKHNLKDQEEANMLFYKEFSKAL